MREPGQANQHGSQQPTILAITANEDDNEIYAITDHGQLISAKIDLNDNDVNSDNYEAKFDYVLGPFHRAEITGLDVCMRKELIATCSRDRTVSIWNYATKTHEASQSYPEECLTIAFHPSGLHLIVALQDKVLMCNVLSSQIEFYKQIPIKGCNEIRFANGGHLFACVFNEKNVHVYNFYTGDSPPNMQFQGHMGRIMSIDWYANDMGFTTCGQDGNIYFYDLYTSQDIGERNRDNEYNRREVKFSSVVNLPGREY